MLGSERAGEMRNRLKFFFSSSHFISCFHFQSACFIDFFHIYCLLFASSLSQIRHQSCARGPGVTNKRWPNSVVNVGRGWRFSFFCTREKSFSFSQIIETLNLVVQRLKLPPVTGTESQFEDAINRGALCFDSRCWLDSYTKWCVFAV